MCTRNKRFNLGDKVNLTQAQIKWFLSEPGIDCYYPPSGKLDSAQQKSLDLMVETMMLLAMAPEIELEVIACNYPRTVIENYKVKLMGWSANIEPKYLKRAV